MRHPSRLRSPLWPRAAVGLVTALCLVSEAGAVITITQPYNGTRSITMRVGSVAGIDTVQFNVANPTLGNSLPLAASVNGNGTAIAASSGGVFIQVIASVRTSTPAQKYTITATSPATLTCSSGGCGADSISFSDISWTMATAPSGLNAAFDIQNGTFVAGSRQSLTTVSYTSAPDTIDIGGSGTADWQATMNFVYANTTPHLAGVYSGTVTYTATFL